MDLFLRFLYCPQNKSSQMRIVPDYPQFPFHSYLELCKEVLLTEKLLFIQNSSSCLHCFPPKKQIKFLFILKIMEQQCFADSSRLCHIRNRRSPVTGVTKHLKSGIYNPLLLFFRQAIKFLVHSTDSLRFLYDSI